MTDDELDSPVELIRGMRKEINRLIEELDKSDDKVDALQAENDKLREMLERATAIIKPLNIWMKEDLERDIDVGSKFSMFIRQITNEADAVLRDYAAMKERSAK